MAQKVRGVMSLLSESRLVCAYCGATGAPHRRRKNQGLQMDHVVPRSRGGPDTPDNIVLACAGCNCAKGARLPSEWLDVVSDSVAAIEDRMRVHLVNSIVRSRGPAPVQIAVCFFCAGRLKLDDAALDFYDQERPPYSRPTATRFLASGGREEYGALCMPGTGARRTNYSFRTVALLTHLDCQGANDSWYWYALNRWPTTEILEKTLEHLRRKPWWHFELEADVRAAGLVARTLEKARPKKKGK